MKDISLKELLEAGCHFGHQVTRQNPKAREFIFQAREGIHVIDLAKTRFGLLSAGEFVESVAARGGTIIFVGTKRQAQHLVSEAAKKAGVFVVTQRWIGGILTNFDQVGKNYKKLKDIRTLLQSDTEKAKYTKREIGLWEKERVKLEKLYGGVADMPGRPDAIFIVDTHKEDLAVREANRTGVPVVGIVDTNADPSVIDYPIPANDDALGSIQLIVNYITDCWIEGKGKVGQEEKKVEQVEKKVEKAEEVKQGEKVEKEAKAEKPKAKKSTKVEKSEKTKKTKAKK